MGSPIRFSLLLLPATSVTVPYSSAQTAGDLNIVVVGWNGIDTVNPVDTFAGAIGNSATSSNVSLQTTAAADLLVAGNTVQSSSIAGSGFTLRLTTSPDGDIAEDKIATTAGTYSASATLSSTSGWVMQAVAFRAGVASPAPTGSKKLTLAWNAKFNAIQAIDGHRTQECDNLASSSSKMQCATK
jgi:hypothetical protein